jgi:hypothetical protein
MARQRRGGGFKPPELRGTLGTLLRTAAAQVGPLREALTDAARARLDDARARYERYEESRSTPSTSASTRSTRRRPAGSERDAALAELGEIVLDLIRRGEIDLGELPEVADVVGHLDDLDAAADEDLHDEPPRSSGSRSRHARDASDDGTVSSRTWARPTAKPAPRVWRPPVETTEPDQSPPVSAPASARHRNPANPLKKGGISFDEDDDSDLAEYMHPDDVPAKKPPDGDS